MSFIILCIVVLTLSFFWLYTKSTADVPRLYAKAGPFKNLLQTQCPLLRKKYIPTFWCPFGSLQTVVRQILKTSKPLPYQREILPLMDGGQIALDWFYPDTFNELTSIVIILPGLTGSTFENYVLHLVQRSLRQGYKTVVFNNRGNGGIELLTSQTYSAAYTDDLQAVIISLRRNHPKAKFFALGLSLGGMILFNYVSKFNAEQTGLVAALVVSSPWDPFKSTESLERFIYWLIFNRRLADNLCRNLARNQHLFAEKINMDHVLSSQSVRQFDERFIVPMFGYKNVNEYYRDAGFYYKVKNVSVPTLCLNAADDCFAPVNAIPFDDVQNSDNVAVVVTSHGGHIAFMKGLTGLGDGLIEDIFAEYSSAVLA